MSDPRMTYVQELLDSNNLGELYVGALVLAATLYGEDGPQVGAVRQLDPIVKTPPTSPAMVGVRRAAAERLRGMLRRFAAELEARLAVSVRVQASSEVLAELVDMARRAADGGQMEVAAVLVSAALEAALKTVEPLNEGVLAAAGPNHDMDGRWLASYAALRESALHAEWERLDAGDVRRLLGFTEGLLSRRLPRV